MPHTRRSVPAAPPLHWLGHSPVDGSSPARPKTRPCSLGSSGLDCQKQRPEEAGKGNFFLGGRHHARGQACSDQMPRTRPRGPWADQPPPLAGSGCPAPRRLQLPGYPPGAHIAGRGRGRRALSAVTKCLIEAGGASRSRGRARTPHRAGLMQSAAAAIQLASN